jgi:hypothetical protein
MSIPGFSGDASVYETLARYRLRASHPTSTDGVSPAQVPCCTPFEWLVDPFGCAGRNWAPGGCRPSGPPPTDPTKPPHSSQYCYLEAFCPPGFLLWCRWICVYEPTNTTTTYPWNACGLCFSLF